jgi:hypothetical protein
MNFLQPFMLWAVPLIALPIAIHLINQWRYQTRRWAPMIFLLQANRMNRGLAKIRQWLILAMRTIAVAGLIFAISRPLVGGLWGMFAGGRVDTAIVVIDRSPSMGQQGPSGETKLQSSARQLASAFNTLRASRWVAIDSATAESSEFANPEALLSSNAVGSCGAAAEIPLALQNALEYIQVNQPGSVDIWLCSDLRRSDWSPDSGDWSAIRGGFESLPQEVRFHLLAYSDSADDNLAIRVTSVRGKQSTDPLSNQAELVLSLQITSSGDAPGSEPRWVPVQVEVDGVRSQIQVELRGGSAELRDLNIALAGSKKSGWGRVSLPADSNNADNEYYFVYENSSVPQVVLVTEDPQAASPLRIAASLSAEGAENTQVTVISPDRVDSEILESACLLIWQAELPDALIASTVDYFVGHGGQVVFFPPPELPNRQPDSSRQYRGVHWAGWKQPGPNPVLVANWRSDQDLLAATQSGAGLPVGQLEIRGYGLLQSESALTPLATLDGGHHLLARLPTAEGGIYFCSADTDSSRSTLAENGVVLFVVVQRAIQSGQTAIQGMRQRVARSTKLDGRLATPESSGDSPESTPSFGDAIQQQNVLGSQPSEWQQVAGATGLSSEYDIQPGIYRDGSRLFAVNRNDLEDDRALIDDPQLTALFDGLQMQRIDQSLDDSSSIFREVWRLFLIFVIVALLLESLLCLPRTRKASASSLLSS